MYAGFDASGFPGLKTMSWLMANTNLHWCGFYLKAPSHPDAGWMKQRAALVEQGWGLAPIYVGQQVAGPGAHAVNNFQGMHDGADAVAQMRSAGFPSGSFVYLDLENGPPMTHDQEQYVAAWASSVRVGGFGAGVYCSYLLVDQIDAISPGNIRIWAFKVPTTKMHAVPGTMFSSPDPATAHPKASTRQYDDACLIGAPSGQLLVDLDSSLFGDPSAPISTAPAASGKQEGPAMADTHMPAPINTTAAAAGTVAVNQSVKVDLGSAAATIIEAQRTLLEHLADAGEDYLFRQIPFGTMIESAIGPHLASQYLDIAVTRGEALAKSTGDMTFANPSTIVKMAVAAFTDSESWIMSFVPGASNKLDSWLLSAAKKAGLNV